MTMNLGSNLPTDIATQIKQQERELVLMGARLGNFDKIRQRELYSSFLFAPGLGGVIPAGEYEVFQAVAGDTGQGYSGPLTLRETNWPSRGRISNNQNLIIRGFHVDLRRPPTDPRVIPSGVTVDYNIPPHPYDVDNFASSCILSIKYLTNTVPIGLVKDFPSVGGAYGWNQAARQGYDGSGSVLYNDVTIQTISAAGGVFPYSNLPITRNSTQAAFERRAKVPTLLQHGEQFSMVLTVARPITLLAQNTAAANLPANRDATGVLEARVSFWATESFVEKS